MRRLLLVFLWLGFLQQPAAAQVPLATRVQVRGADCALFPAAAELPFYRNSPSALPLKRFTPTAKQIAVVEQKLTASLPYAHASIAYCAEPIKKSLSAYKRQYYGFYNDQNHSCFYIRFFYFTPAEYSIKKTTWLRAPVKASTKPGSDVWDLSYNMSSEQFYDCMHPPLD